MRLFVVQHKGSSSLLSFWTSDALVYKLMRWRNPSEFCFKWSYVASHTNPVKVDLLYFFKKLEMKCSSRPSKTASNTSSTMSSSPFEPMHLCLAGSTCLEVSSSIIRIHHNICLMKGIELHIFIKETTNVCCPLLLPSKGILVGSWRGVVYYCTPKALPIAPDQRKKRTRSYG